MKILVYGAGSIGTVFGGLLAKSGEEVVLFGRSEHIEKTKSSGLTITGIWGDHFIEGIKGYSNSDQLKEEHAETFDLILLTVKSYDTSPAMADIRYIAGINTYVLSLQNGIGNIETVAKVVGEAQTLGGRVIFGAEMTSPAHVRVTVSADDVVIGRISHHVDQKQVDDIAKTFTAAGIKTRTSEDIMQVIWSKIMYNCALNPLASLLNVPYGKLIESDHTKDIMRKIVFEIYSIIEKKDIILDPKNKEEYIKLLFNRLIPLTASHRPSMLQDIEKGKRTEIDYLNGMIAVMGKELGIETPVNLLMKDLIKFKDRR